MVRHLIWGLVLLAPLPAVHAQDTVELGKKVDGKLTADDPKDMAFPKKQFKLHTCKLEAGKTYTLDMEGKGFDAYLRLESPDGKPLASNDDRGDGTLHSRIIFKADKEGTYRLIATILNGKPGDYTLSVQIATGAVAAFGMVQTDLQTALQKAQQEFGSAKTQEDKERVVASYYELVAASIGKFGKVIEDFPNDPIAKQAQQTIRQNLAMLGSSDSPAVGQQLRNLMEKGSTEQIRAQAALSLGQSLRSQSEKAYAKDKQRAEKLVKESEDILVMVQDKFGKVDAAIAKQADNTLFEIRNLSIGKVAPDIDGEDTDGKKFKLSDYRGKVVVLDFWGHW